MFFWASSQPTATHALWNYWSLGPYQQKINKGSISVAHPGTPIYVMQLRSGEDPKLQNTLKNASYQGGQAAN